MAGDEKGFVLITGITGGLARRVVVQLRRRFPVIGIDHRTPTRRLVGVDHFTKINYTQSSFENIFRNHRIKKLIHLGRLIQSDLFEPHHQVLNQMHQNSVGTSKLLRLAEKYGVDQAVILSTFHVYGALPDNPIFIKEDAPLKASVHYPDLRDVVELDYHAHIWRYKNQGKIKTTILRPTNIVGPLIKNTFTRYLKSPFSPTVMGFNPPIQAVHEKDLSAIIVRALTQELEGTFNVAPPTVVPLKRALEITQTKSLALPHTVLSQASERLSRVWPSIPRHLLEFYEFPCVIDATRLTRALPDFRFRYSTEEALASIGPKPSDHHPNCPDKLAEPPTL